MDNIILISIRAHWVGSVSVPRMRSTYHKLQRPHSGSNRFHSHCKDFPLSVPLRPIGPLAIILFLSIQWFLDHTCVSIVLHPRLDRSAKKIEASIWTFWTGPRAQIIHIYCSFYLHLHICSEKLYPPEKSFTSILH